MTRPEVGWELWSTQRGWAGIDDAGGRIEPYGGVVVAVTNTIDDETGELIHAYVVRDSHHGKTHRFVLASSEVDWTAAREATDRLITDLARRLARDIANHKHGNNIARLTAEEIRTARDVVALHDQLIERNGPAFYHLDTPPPAQPPDYRPPAKPNVAAICD